MSQSLAAAIAAARAAKSEPTATVIPMAAKAKTEKELHFEKVDIQALPEDFHIVHAEIVKADAALTMLKRSFGTMLADKLDMPKHLTYRVSFKYGVLKVALDDAPGQKRAGLDLVALAKAIEARM